MEDTQQQSLAHLAVPGGERTSVEGGGSVPRAHTPGPWAVDPDLADFDFGAPQKDGTRMQRCRYVHAPKGGGGRIAQCFANCLVTTTVELEANARLIAAAPELLEALQAAQRAINGMKVDAENAALICEDEHVVPDLEGISQTGLEADTAIRAAIAKALGTNDGRNGSPRREGSEPNEQKGISA